MKIALYYSVMTPRPHLADPALVERGRRRYEERCAACHASNAHGSEHFARLAGQHVDYLRHRLFQFQQPAAAPTVMHGIAASLRDEDIQAITAYLASLP